jgi:hypothetical protein
MEQKTEIGPLRRLSYALIEIIFGAALMGLLWLAAENLKWIWDHVQHDILSVLLIVVAVGLFVVRERFRVAYGVAEILVGMIAIVGVMGRTDNVIFVAKGQLLVQIAAGIYIMVRGIDNLLNSKLYAPIWARIIRKGP